jgi:Kdo2-lipid IVA lauroyltransferase/acyltransferase
MTSLVRWLSRRPLWLLHRFGGFLGWLSHALSPSYRQRFRANAALAGVPAHASSPAIAEAGRLALELPFLWLRPADRPIGPVLQMHGA